MAMKLYSDSDISDIADAIRSKNGTANTYKVSQMASAIQAIPTGGGGIRNATGTYTPTETFNTNGDRQITTIATIGFTPKRFLFYASDRTDLYGTQNAVVYAFVNDDDAGNHILTTIRYSNTSGGLGTNNNTNAWTTSSNGYLYLDSGVVYFKSASNAQLIANIDYAWEAYSA